MVAVFIKVIRGGDNEPAWQGHCAHVGTFETLHDSKWFLERLEKRGEEAYAQIGFKNWDGTKPEVGKNVDFYA